MIVNLGNLKACLDGNKRTILECLAELERETNLRIRLYGEWVKNRKLSSMEAVERLERLAKCGELLQKIWDGKGVEVEAVAAAERMADAASTKAAAEAVPGEPNPS